MRRRAYIPALLTIAALSCGCPDEEPAGAAPADTTACGAAPCDTAAPACTPEDPCEPAVQLGYAEAGQTTFDPIHDGASIPVFDGTQGVVATWLTVRVVGIEPPDELRLRLEIQIVSDEDGETLASSGAIPTPFEDGGGGAMIRYEHMVPFDFLCCAEDFAGLDVTVTATVFPEGGDPLEQVLPAKLAIEPFPL